MTDTTAVAITQPRPHQVRTDKMWAAHQVLVQLDEKAQEKVRAPLRPPRVVRALLVVKWPGRARRYQQANSTREPF